MSLNLKTLLAKLTVWLTLEIILNLVGLDTLADYSEFRLGQAANSVHYRLSSDRIGLVN